MEIQYILCNPTGNITALVETKVPIENQPYIADVLMKKEPSCEQVGYIQEPCEGSDITLRMAGGEFCGNATMSTAAYFCKNKGMADGEKETVKVKVIGTSGLIDVTVERKEGRYFGTIEMPSPSKISFEEFSFEDKTYKYPVVSFTGISHVIIEDNIPIYVPEKAIKIWCDRLKVKGLGLILLNKEKTQIRPLVYVKTPESLVWESSCASGTTAAVAFLSKRDHEYTTYSFKEPGGVLSVEATKDGRFLLTGSVEFDS